MWHWNANTNTGSANSVPESTRHKSTVRPATVASPSVRSRPHRSARLAERAERRERAAGASKMTAATVYARATTVTADAGRVLGAAEETEREEHEALVTDDAARSAPRVRVLCAPGTRVAAAEIASTESATMMVYATQLPKMYTMRVRETKTLATGPRALRTSSW